MYCYADDVPTIGSLAFYDTGIEYATLYVPNASIEQYKADDTWGKFGEVVGIPQIQYIIDGEVYKTIIIPYGEPITPEKEPTKEGCTFSGWSEIPAIMPDHDVIITGSFTLIDAIDDVTAHEKEFRIYTLDGKPVETLQKGVNIIRYSDGQTKKVYVK